MPLPCLNPSIAIHYYGDNSVLSCPLSQPHWPFSLQSTKLLLTSGSLHMLFSFPGMLASHLSLPSKLPHIVQGSASDSLREVSLTLHHHPLYAESSLPVKYPHSMLFSSFKALIAIVVNELLVKLFFNASLSF